MKIRFSSLKYLLALALASNLIACGGGAGSENTNQSGGASKPQNNTPPVISGAPSTQVKVGENYSFTPQASDSDGDTLTFSVENLPDWASFDPQTGEISGWPDRAHIGSFQRVNISVSDGKDSVSLNHFTIDVAPLTLTKDSVINQGKEQPLTGSELTHPNHSGFMATGDVQVNFGEKEVNLQQAKLEFEFDENDQLISMLGETLIPSPISNYFSLSDSINAKIGLYKGSEINADPDFGIQLKDDFYYFVYYLGVAAEAVLGDRNNPNNSESLSLDLPSGEIIIISDPQDEFYYYYASTPLGTLGYGESDNGNIPFIPAENFSSLDSFDGHKLKRAAMAVGIKIFDLFEIEGTRVTKEPQFGDIDWTDPLNSPIEFKAGINGNAKFALSVYSVGIFDFELAQASATFDVGFDRQQMAMQMTVEPDVGWQPSWFTIIPSTQIVGNWMVNGDGSFSALLSGEYRSTIPKATMTGSITLNNDGAIFESRIPDPKMPIIVRASFLQPSTLYEVFAEKDISDLIAGDINEAFDRLLAKHRQALQNYQDAVEDYEFEVSLRGIRDTLPTAAENAIKILNSLPAKVGQEAHDETYRQIKKQQQCFLACVPSNSRIGSYARTARNQARDRTAAKIIPYIAAMQELKLRAQQADSTQLRQALEASLRDAYNRRVYSDSVNVSFTITEIKKKFSYSRTVKETILNSQQSSAILNAANNSHKIQETSDEKIRLGDYYQQIPEEQIIERARTETNKAPELLPTFKKAGMTVTHGNVTGYIQLDNTQYSVDFNILDPIKLLKGVGDTIAENKTRDIDIN